MGGRRPEHAFTIILIAFMGKLHDSKKLEKKRNPEQPLTFCKESKQHATRKASAFREQQHSLFLEISQLKTCANTQ